MSRMAGSLSSCISRAEASSRSSALERAEFFRDRRQAGIFHRQIAELALSADDRRVCQRAADFLIAVDHFFEPQSNGVFHANHCKGRRSSYSALHATKHIDMGHFTGHFMADGRVVADGASALSTTNSDGADLVLRRHGAVARRLPRRYRALPQGGARLRATPRFPSAPTRSPRNASRSAPAPRPRGAGRSSIRKAPARPRRWRSPRCGSINPKKPSAAILRTHALGGDEALIKLIGELSDAGGTAIALDTLRPMLESPDVSDRLLARRRRPGARNLRFHHRAQTRGPHARQRAGLGHRARAAGARAHRRRRRGRGHRRRAGSRGARAGYRTLRLRRHAAAPRSHRRSAPGTREPAKRCVDSRRGRTAARQARLPDGRHDRGRAPLR